MSAASSTGGMSPPLQIAAGLASGSLVQAALTGDWLLAGAALASIGGLAAIGALLRPLAR